MINSCTSPGLTTWAQAQVPCKLGGPWLKGTEWLLDPLHVPSKMVELCLHLIDFCRQISSYKFYSVLEIGNLPKTRTQNSIIWGTCNGSNFLYLVTPSLRLTWAWQCITLHNALMPNAIYSKDLFRPTKPTSLRREGIIITTIEHSASCSSNIKALE